MRKILLATTALVGAALGAANAAHAANQPSSPITINVGGYNDFVAGFFQEADGTAPALKRNDHDFEDEFKLNIDAMGKASNGIQYGANIGLWNGPEVTNYWTGGGATVELNSAYVWMSGAFGKILFGDEHGASDLFVYAPTVGEGQIDGRYQDFVSPFTLARFQPAGIDNTEHSTKITYYTPKVGNDDHKVQLGVSYIPTMYDYGSSIDKFNNGGAGFSTVSSTDFNTSSYSPYHDVFKGAIQYTGNFHPVTAAVSAQAITGSGAHTALGSTVVGIGLGNTTYGGLEAQDFTSYGLGAQVGFNGFTVGASYTDQGRYNTVHGQNKAQDIFTLGGKYELDKVSVGASWLSGEGYANMLGTTISGTNSFATTVNETNYVSSFDAYGLGATYTWFPGLTSAIDGVMFNQKVSNEQDHNDGYVVLVSQKLTF